MENRAEILPLVNSYANKYKLDVKLVDAIICQESSYRQWASKFEPGIDTFDHPDAFAKINNISLATEKNEQATSYGLMQLLGRTARMPAINFVEPLPYLYEIQICLNYGCKYLAYLCKKYIDMQDVISAYNRGSPLKIDGKYKNQEYVDGVMKYMKEMN